jgi:hypothetical protein
MDYLTSGAHFELALIQRWPGVPNSRIRRSADPGLVSREKTLTRVNVPRRDLLAANPQTLLQCSDSLPLEAFPLNRRMHLGRSSHCRECAREATRDWRRRNRDTINAERRAAYRDEHPRG